MPLVLRTQLSLHSSRANQRREHFAFYPGEDLNNENENALILILANRFPRSRFWEELLRAVALNDR